CHGGRGKYRLGPMTIESLDFLGIWCMSKTFEIFDSFIILPKTFEIPTFSIGSSQSIAFSGMRTLPKSGMGYEFLGTREYRPGDCLKFIHWPATAHHGTLIVKEFELFTSSQITFFLDLSAKSLQGFKPNTIDYSIEIIASIAKYVTEQGHSFRVVAKGDRWFLYPLNRGAAHLAWILEEMSLMKPLGEMPIEEVVKACLPQLDIGEEVVLVVPTHVFQVQSFLSLYSYLQKKNIKVTLIFLVSQTFEQLYGDVADYLSHSEIPARLSKKGISLYAVEKGQDIPSSLRREMVL
ncbi:MAG: DUF58 domain-containing protein, partial [Planctomycetota bacterium]